MSTTTVSSAAHRAPGACRGSAPIFIACGARSGSTLLRWLIDSHPDIACPSETDITGLLGSYLHTAEALASPSPLAEARSAVDGLMSTYLSRGTKSRWCDKSLSNVLDLDLLAAAWPDAVFLLLHRHCMDFVMSGLEAQPWGLLEYGFTPFAARVPGDEVTALAAYWIDRETKMLDFAEGAPDRCMSIRYEDLVSRTEDILGAVWRFLGVEAAPDAPRRAFSDPHDAFGAADYKVWYTAAVSEDSVGRGARVPADRVRGPVRQSVNELLVRLGYHDTVDAYWGSGGPATGPAASAVVPGETSGIDRIELRVVNGARVLWCRALEVADVADVADVAGATGAAGVGGDGVAATEPDEDSAVTGVVAVEREVLSELCSGSQNLGAALRARTVRYYGPQLSSFGQERAIFEKLGRFVAANTGLFVDLVDVPCR
jgi:hypothetical protein